MKSSVQGDIREPETYLYTPHGIEEKNKVTARFLKRKMIEFDVIKQQIEELKREVETFNLTTWKSDSDGASLSGPGYG
jgi:hypothetical protein